MNVTATLKLSLSQDIYILNRLLQDITKTHDIDNLNSWLFPSKLQNFVSEKINDKHFQNVSYENCLEITIDRLYVLINFFLRYIQNEKSAPTALINEPKKVTIGLCVRELWENIVKLMANEATKKTAPTPGSDNSYMDKQSQTEIVSLNTCDSCGSAIMCMKKILKSFDEQRDLICVKYKIFDITQFGCMLKVTSSIETSLSNLYKKLHQEIAEKHNLKQENDNFRTMLNEKDGKIAFLDEEIYLLRNKMEEGTQKILLLKQNEKTFKQDIANKENYINNLSETLENIKNNLHSMTKQNKVIKSENTLLKSNLEISTKLITRCNKSIENKILKFDQEYDVVKTITEQYEKTVTVLNVKLMKITRNIGKVEIKLKNHFENTNEIFLHLPKYDNFCVEIKEMFKEKLKSINNSTKSSEETFVVKGNPAEDISKQIEENENKIRQLENENMKLRKLLTRFRTMNK